MISFTLKTDTLSPDLRQKMGRVKRPRTVIEAGAKTVQRFISGHMKKLQARGNKKGWPSQHFYYSGANSVEKNVGIAELTDTNARITIADPRFEHHIRGGIVRGKRNDNVALPLTAEAASYTGKGSLRQSAPWLALLVTKKGAYLGKRDKKRIIIMFILLRSVTHKKHPEDLPDQKAMLADAGKAMEKACDILLRVKK